MKSGTPFEKPCLTMWILAGILILPALLDARPERPRKSFLSVAKEICALVEQEFYRPNLVKEIFVPRKSAYLEAAEKATTMDAFAALSNEILESLHTSHTSFFPRNWRKPVVMLINGRSRSGKEILAAGFKKFRIGTIIGETTAGAVVAGKINVLGDGSLLYLAITGGTIDGVNLEGVGVTPDIEIPMPIPYLSNDDFKKYITAPHLSEVTLSVRSDLFPGPSSTNFSAGKALYIPSPM